MSPHPGATPKTRALRHVASVLVLVAASVGAGQERTGALDAAEAAIGASGLSSLRYEGGMVGGHPTIEMTVTGVKPNGAEPVGAMPSIPPGPPCVGCARGNVAFKSDKLGTGAWYLGAGDNFASVVVEFKDYVVVFDAPHDDDRSGPVIAERHRLVPDKPIRYLINSHGHFDHLGGARTFAAEGATVIVAEAARSTVERYLNAPRTLRPDKFTKSGRRHVRVEGVRGTRVLPMEPRHNIPSVHN